MMTNKTTLNGDFINELKILADNAEETYRQGLVAFGDNKISFDELRNLFQASENLRENLENSMQALEELKMKEKDL